PCCDCACFFCFIALAPSQLSPLSLHDALPISNADGRRLLSAVQRARHPAADSGCAAQVRRGKCRKPAQWQRQAHRRERQRLYARSEEHTSELQSRFDLVCRLLLEKKKKQKTEK